MNRGAQTVTNRAYQKRWRGETGTFGRAGRRWESPKGARRREHVGGSCATRREGACAGRLARRPLTWWQAGRYWRNQAIGGVRRDGRAGGTDVRISAAGSATQVWRCMAREWLTIRASAWDPARSTDMRPKCCRSWAKGKSFVLTDLGGFGIRHTRLLNGSKTGLISIKWHGYLPNMRKDNMSP